MFYDILLFIAGLSVLVLVHEFGHFLVALKLGIKVEEFGFGFPPRVWSKKKNGIVYSINALPIGGFVKLYGEDDAGGGKIKRVEVKQSYLVGGRLEGESLDKAFFARPVWQRAVVVFAGVLMNFILAVAVLSYLFTFPGVTLPSGTVKVTQVAKESPAEAVGLVKDDVVQSINAKHVKNNDEFVKEVKRNLGKSVTLVVTHNEEQHTVQVTPRKRPPKGQGYIGIELNDSTVLKYKWYEAPFYGTWEALKFSYLIIEGIVKTVTDLVFHGIKPEGVAGPVGVFQLSKKAAEYGFNAWLWFMALISLNLAVLNVLPIPALDGGRLFFILVEGVTGRKVSQKYESMAHAVGLAVLLGLMALITMQDILRAISGKSILPTP